MPDMSSVIAAAGTSAAAGKNPWLPLGALFALAASDHVPSWLMSARLHASLHDLASERVFVWLAVVFLVLAVLDALGDKVPFIQKWLVPLSTAWRPIAAIAVSLIIARASVDESDARVAYLGDGAPHALHPSGAVVFGMTVLAGALFGVLATIGKTGTRLLLSIVPAPGLKFAHSLFDDLFAVLAILGGLVLGGSTLGVVLAGTYVLVGAFVAPPLWRLTWIHVLIVAHLLRKARRKTQGGPNVPSTVPRAVARAVAAEGIPFERAVFLRGYVLRSRETGMFRPGYVVFAPQVVLFVSRSIAGVRVVRLEAVRIARLGLAQTLTTRIVTLAGRGRDREFAFNVYLFPATAEEVLPVIERGVAMVGLLRALVTSESARRSLPGHAAVGRSPRFIPASAAGDLRAQAVLTIAVATTVGILTGGAFVPVGAGYLLSALKRRFVFGLVASIVLAAIAVATFGVALPACILSATMLNVIALRDLTRHCLFAAVNGFVDRSAFLPPVSDRVWIPQSAIVATTDIARTDQVEWVRDGSWRAVVALLRTAPANASRAGATGGRVRAV